MPATIQLRVAPALNERIKRQAGRENVSANKLLLQAVTRYLETERKREWRAGFEAMEHDPDTNTAEPFFPAAREVFLIDEHESSTAGHGDIYDVDLASA